MMLLPLYALAVWFICFRLRRKWMGWFALFAGVSIVLSMVYAYPYLQRWFTGESTRWSSFQFVMWAEAIMVSAVGVFILCLPREVVQVPCRKCRYELESLAAEHHQGNPRCPECGLEHAVRKLSKKELEAERTVVAPVAPVRISKPSGAASAAPTEHSAA